MMERDNEPISQIDQLMYSDEYRQKTQEFDDFIYFVYCYCRGKTSEDEESHVRYSSRDDILPGLKDILSTIPRYNMKKSMEHLLILNNRGLALVLAELLDSSIKENKEIAKECVRLFLIDPKTNSGFFFPNSIQNQCASIVLTFCGLFREATDEDEHQLYCSCRETLVFILKSIAFSNRARYFGIAKKSHLIAGLYRFVSEIVDTKLRKTLESIYESPSSLSTCDVRSLKRDFQEFGLFSLHLLRAIEDHIREKGLSLPVDVDDLEEGENPCYPVQIFMFHCDFSSLVKSLEEGLEYLEEAIRDAGGNLKFNTGWSLFISVFMELHNISELLSAAFREFRDGLSYQELKEGR